MSLQDLLVAVQSGISLGGSGPLIVAAGLILILVVLGGVALYVSYVFSPRGRLQALMDSRARKRRNPWPLRAVIVALLIMAPLGINYYVSRPANCARCHTKTSQVRLSKTAHRNLECMECHGYPGAVGALNDQVSYARWTWAYYVENRKSTNKALFSGVRSEQCLGCHASVAQGVSEHGGIRVRHSDFLANGASCVSCHEDVSHKDTAVAKGPSMDECLPCHDGKRASSDCKTCHVKDIAQTASTDSRMQAQKLKSIGGANSCYECHDPKPCLRCHGVMMPHPQGWGPSTVATGGPGTHPLQGFTDRETCYRCHFAPGKPFVGSNEGCSCHGFLGTMHGGSVWVKEHGLEASGKKAGSLSECATCHVTPDFCEYCHPASIMEKYKPVIGPDNYPRQYQPTPNEQLQINGL